MPLRYAMRFAATLLRAVCCYFVLLKLPLRHDAAIRHCCRRADYAHAILHTPLAISARHAGAFRFTLPDH